MINSKDTEALSAYLDDQLDPRERRRLEARLQREPALQTELESLDRTRRMLRAAPRYRAPRNFTLTPEMAGIPDERPGFFFSLTRFAFTLTTIMFLVALVGNFSFGLGGLGGSQPQNPVAFTMEADSEMAPLEEPVAGEAEDAAADSGPAAEDGERTMPVEESMEAESMEGASVEEGEPSEEIQALAPPAEESLSVGEEETVAADPPAEGTLTAPEADTGPVEEIPVTETPAPPEIAAAPADGEQPAEATGSDRINPWSIFTVLTGAAALISGALTLLLRKR